MKKFLVVGGIGSVLVTAFFGFQGIRAYGNRRYDKGVIDGSKWEKGFQEAMKKLEDANHCDEIEK